MVRKNGKGTDNEIGLHNKTQFGVAKAADVTIGFRNFGWPALKFDSRPGIDATSKKE